ncbi:MAG TPA: ankyrin repeat domain-containing protein [Planctomycetaceae bacterium]|nr:ankyrin repeat domain-containing protein [Planctomycetaceae bacterium]HQZ67292.1 ankyrin repeat domain-containing protein [Planctomycetaceae bacterium]
MTHEYLDNDDDAMVPLIHRAAGRDDEETVLSVLDDEPAAINGLDAIGNQPLHTACWSKHLTMVRLLLNRGADVNARGDFGETPLHHAVRDDGPEANAIVALLVESGADIEAKDDRLGQNPLGWALREFNDDLQPTIQLLRDRGSLPGLEGAMILGDTERVRYLLSESADQLSTDLVFPVLELSKSCGQLEISGIIGDWLAKIPGRQ